MSAPKQARRVDLAVTPVPGGRASLTWHGDVSGLARAVEAPEAADL